MKKNINFRFLQYDKIININNEFWYSCKMRTRKMSKNTNKRNKKEIAEN